jgi:hypothetical protein
MKAWDWNWKIRGARREEEAKWNSVMDSLVSRIDGTTTQIRKLLDNCFNKLQEYSRLSVGQGRSQ